MNLCKAKMSGKPEYRGMAALGLALLCMCSAFLRPLYSGDIDNYTMALVANKLFTGEGQDGYISYVHLILCKVFEGVHALLPSADAFTLTANVMLFAAVWMLGYAIARVVKSRLELAGCYSLVFAVVFINDLFHDNFTRWAAFLSAAGVILLLFASHGKLCERRWIIAGTVFVSLGMMWRFEALFIFVPYLFFDFAVQALFGAKNAKERKEFLVRMVKTAALPVLCVVVLFASNYQVRNSEPYKEAVAFDDIRSLVLDYPIRAWEEVREEIPDISKNDYESVYGWVLLDTERIDTEFLTEMKEAGEKPAYGLSVKDFINMQKRVLSVFMESRHLQYLCIIAGFLFMLIVLSDMAWYYKAEAFFCCVGTDLIYLFFAYMGRAIERVYMTALYALIISMAVLLFTEVRAPQAFGDAAAGVVREKLSVFCRYALPVLACLGIFYEVWQGDFTLDQSVFSANREVENKYEEFCQEDELYFWRVGQYVNGPVRFFMERGKLMPAEFLTHHMYDGAWVYGQVYFTQLLENVHAPNPMEALLTRENTYYVANDCSYVLSYLQEHYNEKITAVQVKEIDGIPVWKFEPVEERTGDK